MVDDRGVDPLAVSGGEHLLGGRRWGDDAEVRLNVEQP
jgi:hypothetical protein